MELGGKGVEERLADGLPIDRDSITAGVGQETSVVVIENSGALSSEVNDVVLPADIRSVQVTGDAENQRSTSGEGVRQERKGRDHGEMGRGPGFQDHTKMAQGVCVATLDKVCGNVLVKIEERVEKIKAEKLTLHGRLVTKREALAHAYG